MPLYTFLLYSFIGSLFWTTTLTVLGYILQNQYDIVAGYLDVLSKTTILLIVVVYIYRVVTFHAKDKT